MQRDFLHATLGKVRTPVFRLGLSATYRPGIETIHRAIGEGLNYLFCFGIDTQMTAALRDVLRRDREHYDQHRDRAAPAAHLVLRQG